MHSFCIKISHFYVLVLVYFIELRAYVITDVSNNDHPRVIRKFTQRKVAFSGIGTSANKIRFKVNKT